MTPGAGQTIGIGPLSSNDLKWIGLTRGGRAWNADPALWARYLADQEEGTRKVLVVRSGNAIIAYGNLVLAPSYQPFAEKGIAEINNLVVAETARRQGLATRLISAFEELARGLGRNQIGMGVGLYRDYGIAQRLYVRLGYVPDGNGVTYRAAPVAPGASCPVDDDLVLWLIKTL